MQTLETAVFRPRLTQTILLVALLKTKTYVFDITTTEPFADTKMSGPPHHGCHPFTVARTENRRLQGVLLRTPLRELIECSGMEMVVNGEREAELIGCQKKDGIE